MAQLAPGCDPPRKSWRGSQTVTRFGVFGGSSMDKFVLSFACAVRVCFVFLFGSFQ